MLGQFNKEMPTSLIGPFGATYVLEQHTDGRSHLPECDRVPRRNVNNTMSSLILAWAGLAFLHVFARVS